eukprot:TRINITY_DN2448_c0_g1_i1.p1 TRINITY_DN2448_c0_g1~~TRINITY_DN2448_c0_g1_i1.p1  ORF type:complete len:449 (+),score=56.73 TRINITY_DN2448_c0_g1_i1:58-1404(+)
MQASMADADRGWTSIHAGSRAEAKTTEELTSLAERLSLAEVRGPFRNEHRPRGAAFLPAFGSDLRALLPQATRTLAPESPAKCPLKVPTSASPPVARLGRNPYRHCATLRRKRYRSGSRGGTPDTTAKPIAKVPEAEDSCLSTDSDTSVGCEPGVTRRTAGGDAAAKRKRASDAGGVPAKRPRCFPQLSPLGAALAHVDVVGGSGGFDANGVRELFLRYQRMQPDPPSPPTDEEDRAELWLCGRGLEALERDLGWPSTSSPAPFALLFALGTKYLHLVSLSEWMRAFRYLGVRTVEEARRRALLLHRELLRDRSLYVQYVCYSFKYVNKARKRVVDRDLVLRLLSVVVGNASPFTELFGQYLRQTGVQVMNFDQWRNFVPFSWEIRTDFSNFSANDAWPTLYDGFAEWAVAQRHGCGRPREGADDVVPAAQRRRVGPPAPPAPGGVHT